MPLHLLDNQLWFPPVDDALDDGLLAIGGDVSIERLLLAYRNGIFPWSDSLVPVWYAPDPRFVLLPDELKISKSMKQLIKRNAFEFKVNTAFEQVIRNCQQIEREDQDGTWITEDLLESIIQLHKQGYAFSAEAWLDDELVGGLYGILMGGIFFGESMFSYVSNASKYAFIKWVEKLKENGIQLVDCQVYTAHLESLGARTMPRKLFMQILHSAIR